MDFTAFYLVNKYLTNMLQSKIIKCVMVDLVRSLHDFAEIYK